MNEQVVRVCPYENCRWEYTEPPLEPREGLTVEASLAEHIAGVEAELKKHLDAAHPGWTLEDLERESLQQQVRAVFKASPFGPTTPRQRWGSKYS